MLLKMSADSVSMLSEYVVGSEGYTDWYISEQRDGHSCRQESRNTGCQKYIISNAVCEGERHRSDLAVQDVSVATITETVIVNIVNYATLRH